MEDRAIQLFANESTPALAGELASFCSETRESALGVGCRGRVQGLDFSRILISRWEKRVRNDAKRELAGVLATRRLN
jgi:hypothetical protein